MFVLIGETTMKSGTDLSNIIATFDKKPSIGEMCYSLYQYCDGFVDLDNNMSFEAKKIADALDGVKPLCEPGDLNLVSNYSKEKIGMSKEKVDDVKCAEIHLDYYKQGDDLGYFVDELKDPILALRVHADKMKQVAVHLYNIASVLGDFPNEKCEIEANTHLIQISGPNIVINKLVELGLAEIFDFDDEDCIDDVEEEINNDEDSVEECDGAL